MAGGATGSKRRNATSGEVTSIGAGVAPLSPPVNDGRDHRASASSFVNPLPARSTVRTRIRYFVPNRSRGNVPGSTDVSICRPEDISGSLVTCSVMSAGVARSAAVMFAARLRPGRGAERLHPSQRTTASWMNTAESAAGSVPGSTWRLVTVGW